MIRELTCIECPKGCRISVDIQDDKITSIKGFQCKKGEAYAKEEVDNPVRILTATVTAEGLPIKLIPVRTNKPISKSRLFEAMESIGKLKVDRPVRVGEILQSNFILDGVDLVSTRNVP